MNESKTGNPGPAHNTPADLRMALRTFGRLNAAPVVGLAARIAGRERKKMVRETSALTDGWLSIQTFEFVVLVLVFIRYCSEC
jgi:hypothetical protein